MSEVRIEHPNRDKAESKATKAIVVLLLLVSAGLVLVITLGGWSELQGAQPVAFVYVILLLVMAYYVAPVEPRGAPRGRRAGGAVRGTRRGGGPGLVRPRQGRLRRPHPRAGHPGPAHRDPGAGAVAPARHSPCAASRRSGTWRSRCEATRPVATSTRTSPAPIRSRPARRVSSATRPGGGTADAGPSKGPVLRGVWVRIPPRALRRRRRLDAGGACPLARSFIAVQPPYAIPPAASRPRNAPILRVASMSIRSPRSPAGPSPGTRIRNRMISTARAPAPATISPGGAGSSLGIESGGASDRHADGD